MHVGKIKYRDQHQNDINSDQDSTSCTYRARVGRLARQIVTAYKHLSRAHCEPAICLGAQAPQRGELFNAHVSARCHEPGSDAEDRSRHGGGAPPQKKTEAKRYTPGRNRALFAGAVSSWARSFAVTNTDGREPGVRSACTWARSCTVINAERSKPGPRSIFNCVCASLFLVRVLFGLAMVPSQVRAPHARG